MRMIRKKTVTLALFWELTLEMTLNFITNMSNMIFIPFFWTFSFTAFNLTILLTFMLLETTMCFILMINLFLTFFLTGIYRTWTSTTMIQRITIMIFIVSKKILTHFRVFRTVWIYAKLITLVLSKTVTIFIVIELFNTFSFTASTSSFTKFVHYHFLFQFLP